MNQRMKILIAYDGSSYADDALKELRRAGLPAEAEVLILSVAEPVSSIEAMGVGVGGFSAEVAELDPTGKLEQARTLAQQAGERVKQQFSGWRVSTEVGEVPPAAEIIRKAEEWGANLIVVGSRGLSILSQLLIGSVSQKVLNEAHCSVRIARVPADADSSIVRILVAVDGSPNAEAAVQAVAARAWPEGAEIRLLAADDPFNHPGGYTLWDHAAQQPDSSEETKKWISQVIEAPAELLRAAGLNVSHAIRWGDARHVILEEAAEWKADSIFVGARGLGRFQRFLLGSVSSAVAARAHCSVEVVRSLV